MRIAFIICTLLLCLSCNKKYKPGSCVQTCHARGANIGLSGYTLDEVDTVLVSNYVKNNRFDSLMSTEIYAATDSSYYPATKYWGLLLNFSLGDNYDYEFSIPATGQHFRIAIVYTNLTEIVECNTKGRCELKWKETNITGGQHDGYSLGLGMSYIFLKR